MPNASSPPVSPHHMTAFVNGYIETMLFASNDESNDSGGVPLSQNYSADDLTPEARASIEATCARFVDHALDLVQAAVACPGYDWAQAGGDLWYTSGGHGVGYWDRTELPGELGQALTERCQHKEMYVEVGEDQRLHHHGTEYDYRTEAQRIQAEMKVLRATLDDTIGPVAAPTPSRARL